MVGAAAASLDSTVGLFRVLLPDGLHVSLSTARSLGLGAARLYASENPLSTARTYLEADRGAAIDFANLRLCGQTTYSFSAFVDFPREVPDQVRRARGSVWAIPLCGADGTVQLSVGVPDNPTDLQVVDGELVVPTGGGSAYFSSAGVPIRYPWGLPLTPEEAVQAVFALTGRRVSSVPVAYDQRDENGFGQLPLCASWRVEIEAPVVVRRELSGDTSSIAEFYVRRAPACFSDDVVLYAATASQPASIWLVFPSDSGSSGSGGGIDSVEVTLSGPVHFEKVTIVPQPDS